MRKYTPGPWKVERWPKLQIWSNNTHVADVTEMHENTEVDNESNAYLLAAAPEMLAALKAVFQARAPQLNFDFSNAPDMQMLKRVIEKAEGPVVS